MCLCGNNWKLSGWGTMGGGEWDALAGVYITSRKEFAESGFGEFTKIRKIFCSAAGCV